MSVPAETAVAPEAGRAEPTEDTSPAPARSWGPIAILLAPFTLVSWLLSSVLILLIRVYKLFVSPLLPPMCRFEPTCSVYFAEALRKKGLIRGSLLGVYRILRCQPACEGGYDPVE